MATIRAEETARLVIESNGTKGVSRAMIEAGYPETTARNPQQLTRSKAWPQLLEKYLPEKHLGKKHRQFLDAPRRIRTYKKGDLVEETEETDPSAVKALDMAYKLKGKYAPTGGNNVLVINVSGQTSERYSVKAEPVPSTEQNSEPSN